MITYETLETALYMLLRVTFWKGVKYQQSLEMKEFDRYVAIPLSNKEVDILIHDKDK